MKDCKNRIIDNRIIEVCATWTNQSAWEARKEGYYVMLAHEFFRDGCNPKHSVPAMFAAQSNSNYYGWQMVDLSTLDKDAYRPEGQVKWYEDPVADGVDRYAISEAGHYDQAMNCKVWYRYVEDEKKFLDNCRTVHTSCSDGMKRLILDNMGFQFCFKRQFSCETYRDCYGYVGTGYAEEVWAHSNGVVASFNVFDNHPAFGDCEIWCKFNAHYWDLDQWKLSPDGGSMSYSGKECPGTVTNYQSAPRYLRWLLDHPKLIHQWREGSKGFEHLHLWAYMEQEYFESKFEGADFFDYHRKDVARLCEQNQLLCQIIK